MGAWKKNKVDSSQINGGQEYTRDSNPSIEQLNAITNNSFYAVDKADEALVKANSAFENNGTIVRVGETTVTNLSFYSDPQTQIDDANDKILSLQLKDTTLQNSLNNCALNTLSNVTYPQFIADGNIKSGASDRVIESYISSDGNSWYIKWASGRKECGGRFSTGESKTPTNVAYGITFSVDPLVLQVYPRQSFNNSSVVAVKIIRDSISNTGFKAVGCYAGDSTGYTSVPAGFYACGY